MKKKWKILSKKKEEQEDEEEEEKWKKGEKIYINTKAENKKINFKMISYR